MVAQLRSDEQWIAYGRVRTSWSVWKNGPTVLWFVLAMATTT
jgi:hypothetical protein